MYGLTTLEWETLQKIFARNERIEQVVLYGSRAKGTHKPFSDVDLTLFGERLTRQDLNHLAEALDESLLPYHFDISLFRALKNEALKEHIHRIGKPVYQRQESPREGLQTSSACRTFASPNERDKQDENNPVK